MVTSFAMVLDVTIHEILDVLGHDGSEIYWPELDEPMRRRGFHIQEMIDFCHLRGYSVTPFQAIPNSLSIEAGPTKFPNTFWTSEARISRALQNKAVITGYTLQDRRHAVAWDGNNVLDPSGSISKLEQFQIEIVWVVR